MPKGLPLPKTLALIVAVFVWFGSSAQPRDSWARRQIGENPWAVLNPIVAVLALVARDGDDRLFYNYAQLMVGQPPDLEYLSTKEQGDPQAARARLQGLITAPGAARLPYRDFPVEYPPVPLLLMLLPRLFVSGYYPYRMLFTGFIAALFMATAWLAARVASVTAPDALSVETVWRRMGWLLLATGPILCQRFDMLPAALLAAAVAALVYRRDGLGGVALGLAVMSKLYPLLLCVPLAALFIGAGQWRRVTAVAGACATTIAVISAPFLFTAPAAFLRSNALYGARPFHFESTWGSLLLALHGRSTLVSSFGSLNVASPGWLLQLASLVLLGGLLAFAVAAWKSGRALAETSAALPSLVVPWTFATLLFVLCTSKVLSPQFFIWLLPLAVLFPGPRGKRIFFGALAISGLTQIFYPPLYGLARQAHPIALVVLLVRNTLLVALAVYAARAARTARSLGPAELRD
jgi:uncharacterized membrane protein